MPFFPGSSRRCRDLLPEERGRGSSGEREESVCETTRSSIVLLGRASSERLQKACNQIKGCWDGEGGSEEQQRGRGSPLISTCHWSAERGLNNAAGGEAGAKLDGQIGLLLERDNGTMREGWIISQDRVGHKRCNGNRRRGKKSKGSGGGSGGLVPSCPGNYITFVSWLEQNVESIWAPGWTTPSTCSQCRHPPAAPSSWQRHLATSEQNKQTGKQPF